MGVVRIANCSGYYGDRLSAAREMVEGGPIDVLTGDWLAELTMLILAMDQLRSPEGGYARTFVRQMEDVLPTALERGIRIVSNAGGLNPNGLAAAVEASAKKLGVSPRIAVVTGDDLRARLMDWQKAGRPLLHADTGEPLTKGQPLTANVYLGCRAVAEALERGADIVITGRVTDAAVVMGPAAWHHGWGPTDVDALAGALVAGHVIECGCQATGGNFSFWDELPAGTPGFPIAEISADGSSVITKHPGTGGAVTAETVTAQLLYEIGAPEYVSPDAIAHFDTIELTSDGPDRVRISGVVGSPPPPTLKLGITVATGHRNELTALIGGTDAERKARHLEAEAWAAVGGREQFESARSDLFLARSDDPETPGDALSFLTFSVRDPDARKVGTKFTAPLVELALSSIPGLTFTTGPQKPRPIGVFWPTLVPRDDVAMQVTFEGQTFDVAHPPSGPLRHHRAPGSPQENATYTEPVRLGDRCGARSGDKGGHANVGVWVREPAHYDWLVRTLTVERVRDWLAPSGFDGEIERWELPNLSSVNFLIHGWLDRGVASNLAPDPQAKCLGEFFRSKRLPG
ncbi:MAG: acyclic terpene utilization AtuA family protein [Myxococcota bacterium]